MAKFIMYKLFIVRRRGFDKNDRKMIILPKTVKKLNKVFSIGRHAVRGMHRLNDQKFFQYRDLNSANSYLFTLEYENISGYFKTSDTLLKCDVYKFWSLVDTRIRSRGPQDVAVLAVLDL